MSKKNFFNLDGLIRVEEINILLKTYTHRCEERSDEAIYSIAYLAQSVIASLLRSRRLAI